MLSAEEQLAKIGFARPNPDRSCWRVTRLDGPVYSESETAPECSRALMRWRVLLARNPRPSPYRISRVPR